MFEKINKQTIDILGTLFGSFIMAVAISLFLLPNELSSGGIAGIGTILYYTLKLPIGITMLVLNIPLFVFSGYKIGKEFLIKSIIGTVSLSIFTDMLDKFQALTNDKILACVYGGILMGIGTAVMFKCNSSTGGSDLVSVLIKKYNPKIEVGRAMVIIDGVIIILNIIFLGNIEIGLYSAIAIYLMGVMIDIVFEGIFFSKLMFIISDKSEEIAKEIKTKVSRGVTGLYGKGMYKNTDKLILICALGRRDIANAKSIILSIDKNAFVILTNSREVLGYGFKRNM